MRRKNRRVSQIYGSCLVNEMKGHIEKLAARYRAVGNDADHVDSGSRTLYADFRQRFATLR
jgi:hypothetical protein